MSMTDLRTNWGWKTMLIAVMAALAFSAPTHAADEDEKIEDVAGHMEIISRNFKKLRRMVTDAEQNKDSAKLVAEMIKHAEAAAKMEPPLADKAADKEAFMKGYQKMMAAFTKEMGVLKKALDEDRNGDAATSYRKLLNFKKDGHEQFTE